MPYDRPSLTELIERIENDYAVRVDNSQTFLQKSVYKIFAKVQGGGHHLMYDFIEYVKDQLFITSADEETLEKIGAEYGILRGFGEKATGQALATGVDGITVTVGTELQTDSGNKYKVLYDGTVSSGQVNLDIEAVGVGTDYDENAGVVLTFSQPIVGINSTATVIGDGITDGIDADTKEGYRIKILNRKRKPPHGGTEEDYEQWALEYSGNITRAWTIPEYQGIGTIGLAFVKDNDPSSIFPSEAERIALRAYLVSHYDETIGKYVGIPVTAEPGFFVIGLEPYSVNMTLQLYPNNSSTRANIQAKYEELIKQASGPGYTIAISQFYEAITGAAGEIKSKILYPSDDVVASIRQLHVPGTITFQDYV